MIDGDLLDITFTLPRELKLSLNKIYSGGHFSIRSRHKDMYRDLIKKEVENSKINPVFFYPVHCTYRFIIGGRRLDCSNYGYMVKLIEDALVHNGILRNDSYKEVSGITVLSEKNIEDNNSNNYVSINIRSFDAVQRY